MSYPASAATITQKTLRVPRYDGPSGDGSGVARQMDAVLVGAGFKASRELLEHVSSLEPDAAMDLAVGVVGAARRLVGDHVAHNSYFINFPHGVPDTVEFWVRCLRNALVTTGIGGDGGAPTDEELLTPLQMGLIGLLDLPTYGAYQHTYAELLAAHDELIPSVKDRVTVLHLGDTISAETENLYRALAGSTVPLGEADLALLGELAEICRAVTLEKIPIRENRAVINTVRLRAGLPLVAVATVTDVLRIASRASGGDATLAEPTKFVSLGRPQRRVLLAALNEIIEDNRAKLGDISKYSEQWKRLGERLHPYEYPYPFASEVFAVARGDLKARSLTGRAEVAFGAGDIPEAARILAVAPGLFMRSLDRLLRNSEDFITTGIVLDVAASVLEHVSGRVLLSVREHFMNRTVPDAARVFVTRSARARAIPDARPPVAPSVIERLCTMLDAEVSKRLPSWSHLVVDPAILDVALPLTGTAAEDGFTVYPRGSRNPIDGDVLRFFTYWRQTEQRTDFDLSALLLNDQFEYVGHVSWTQYRNSGIVYSGDITDAPNGATEFIEVPLGEVNAAHIAPQVHVYSGEGFNEVAESMFGWMTRQNGHEGAPFDARTVQTRSDMRGTGRVALPAMFSRQKDGTWVATWLHLYLNGTPTFNQTVEGNKVSTATLVRAVDSREYLLVADLVELHRQSGARVSHSTEGLDGPVTYLGTHRPEALPEGSEVITVADLKRLVPA